MNNLKEAAGEFLSKRRIAVAGVSRKGDVPANLIYRKLKAAGYAVFPINPNAEIVEGDRCYPDLASVSGGVEAVVIATHPRVTAQLVRECIDLGIRYIWMHRSLGQGSVDDEAVRLAQEEGLSVIPGGCPMMFCEPVDIFHRCMLWVVRVPSSGLTAANFGDLGPDLHS